MIKEYAEIIDGVVNQVLVMGGTQAEAIAWLKANVSKNKWIHAKVVDKATGKESAATRGGSFDTTLKHFLPAKPYSNWVLDKDRLMFIPPLPKPLAVAVGYVYIWSQKLNVWVKKKLRV